MTTNFQKFSLIHSIFICVIVFLHKQNQYFSEMNGVFYEFLGNLNSITFELSILYSCK